MAITGGATCPRIDLARSRRLNSKRGTELDGLGSGIELELDRDGLGSGTGLGLGVGRAWEWEEGAVKYD